MTRVTLLRLAHGAALGLIGATAPALAQAIEPLTIAAPGAAQAGRPATLPGSDEIVDISITPEQARAFSKRHDYYPYSAAGRELRAGGAAKATNEKIVGGAQAAQGAYPFQVALLRVKRTGPTTAQIVSQFCGGTLLTSRYVLTAAHCFVEGEKGKVSGVTNAKDVGVHVGATNIVAGGDKILAKRVIIHPKYVTGANVNDIALVELERAPKPETGAKAVTVVDLPSEPEYLPANGELTIIGWGKTESGKGSLDLLETKINAVDRAACNRILTSARLRDGEVQKALGELSFEFNLSPLGRKTIENSIIQAGGTVTPQMFCAAAATDGRDTCGGDSGGPILRKDASGKMVQVGIVSFGVGQCGRSAIPGVYTRLALYTDWLRSVVEKPSPPDAPVASRPGAAAPQQTAQKKKKN
jgi:secreted trypsin-like serine protease